MNIQTSTAKVYHGGNRRWFTKKAAERAEAWRILKDHCCDCQEGDYHMGGADPPITCDLHKLRADFRDKVLKEVLKPTFLHPEANDPDLFSEVINELVWAIYAEQQEEERQNKETALTDILML